MGTVEPKKSPLVTWVRSGDEFDGVRERLAEAMNRAGASRRSIESMSDDVDRQQVGRFLSGKRVPGVAVFVAVAKALGVSLEWLLTGEDPLARSAGPDLGQPLPGLLYELETSGLAGWSSRPPAGVQPPTIAEALRALRELDDERASGRPWFFSDGARSVRWAEYFAAIRAGRTPGATVQSKRRTMDADEAALRVPPDGLAPVPPEKSTGRK